MRISDWSSDVCSSDLRRRCLAGQHRVREVPRRHQRGHPDRLPPQLDLGIRQLRGAAHDVGPLGLLGEVLGEGGTVIDLAARFGRSLALLHAPDRPKVFPVLTHYPCPTPHHSPFTYMLHTET